MTARRGGFTPTAFPGTRAPAGPSPEALRKLGLSNEAEEDKPEVAPEVDQKPAQAGRRARSEADSKPSSVEHPPEPARGRPAKDERVQRSIRFTPSIDAKLRELAEARGIDINAAVSVAIAEDWRWSVGPYASRG